MIRVAPGRSALAPMLATAGPLPTGPQWAYEVKWDGFRAVYADGRFRGRSGRQLSGPPLPRLPEVLDGELVALDATGLPSFHAMQQGTPPVYVAFDVIRPELTYDQRREILDRLILPAAVTVSPSFDDGPATVAAARELGLEGVMAKRRASRYQPGVRSPDWIKWKFVHTGDFVIGGWRAGARPLGALLVGTPLPDGTLRYRGRVGGGLTVRTERALLPVLRELVRPVSPFTGPTEPANWVEPLLVAEVRYSEITPDGRLRFPIFLRLRPDKLPGDCLGEDCG
ncbi:ATP-dependent DNA ligase [Catellatospora methionotrophica]|uniref:ATP dependent DNA ligase n=1 Tax=Catellatospora methionotrophica TaxID=121620 RepID=UPI003F4CF876